MDVRRANLLAVKLMIMQAKKQLAWMKERHGSERERRAAIKESSEALEIAEYLLQAELERDDDDRTVGDAETEQSDMEGTGKYHIEE